MSPEMNNNVPDISSKVPSREVIIGIALIAPVLLGLLLRFYLLPDVEQVNSSNTGNNALMLIGSEESAQNISNPESKLTTDGLNTLGNGTALPAFQNTNFHN